MYVCDNILWNGWELFWPLGVKIPVWSFVLIFTTLDWIFIYMHVYYFGIIKVFN